jgi:hypothetical protein
MHCKILQGKVTIEQHEPGMNLEGKQFLPNALHVMKLIMCNILSTLPNALPVMKLIMCDILSTLPNALPVMKLIMCDILSALPNALPVMKLIMCDILSTLPNALPVMKLIMCDMVGYYIRYTQSRKVGKTNNKKNWKQGNQRF